MFNDNTFDGNFDALREGGGFVKVGGNLSSPGGSSSQKEKVVKQKNLIACTIAEMYAMDDVEDQLKVGSIVADMVTVVGLIVSVEELSTKVLFRLDDMTSDPILIQLWAGQNEPEKKESRSQIVEENYVRVVGAVRSIGGIKQMIAFKICSITDVNELTMHMLEVIHSRMSIHIMDTGPVKRVMEIDPVNNAVNTTVNNNAKSFMANGLEREHDIVYQYMLANVVEEGDNAENLARCIPSLSLRRIQEILGFLNNEGHIYTTNNDEHFKALDM